MKNQETFYRERANRGRPSAEYDYILLKPALNGTWIEWNPVFSGTLTAGRIFNFISGTSNKRNLPAMEKSGLWPSLDRQVALYEDAVL
jgi:hypothetical protein